MSQLLHRIRLIRQTEKLYRDHADSVKTFLNTTGHAHEVEGAVAEIVAFRQAQVAEILDGDLDNEPVV